MKIRILLSQLSTVIVDLHPTPLATFIGSDGAYDSFDNALHMCLPLVLRACLHATSTPSASGDDIGHATLLSLVASAITEKEMGQLHGLLFAFRSTLSGASTSTSTIEPRRCIYVNL